MNNYPFVSVIIPTFNRCHILKKTLTAFLKQNYPESKLEIVVIDDGSFDNIKKTLKALERKTSSLEIKYFYQKNKGPAAARNLGIKNCHGEIVLIVNDDVIPSKSLVSQHISFHRRYPEDNFAVLGFVAWSSEIKITAFMEWLGNSGPQFNYNQIRGVRAEWWHAWTCNISFKKSFLLKYGLFDSDFPYAAWEDIELGYRLSKHNLKLLYNKDAVGYHYHPTTINSMIEKMKKNGASAVILGQKISEQNLLPPLARKKAGRLIDFLDRIFFNMLTVFFMEQIVLFAEKRFYLGFLYNLFLLHYRIVGRREFLQNGQKAS